MEVGKVAFDAPMHGLPFWWVDVFATRAAISGNRLMVFVPAAEAMENDDLCRRIAVEVGFSEVTFLVPDGRERPEDAGSYRARIFTPSGELGYAGHPTLGSAVVWALETAPMVDRVTLTQKTSAAVLRVQVERRPNEIGHMAWTAVPEAAMRGGVPLADVASALGVGVAGLEPGGLPVRLAEGPSCQLLVPVVPAVLDAIAPNPPALMELSRGLGAGLVYAFAPPGGDGRIRARGFGHGLGIPEDPATGSAAGYLARYLVEHDAFGPGRRLVVEQGERVGRPSELLLARREDGELTLGGVVRTVARGRLLPEFVG
jgi:trans-2,3-dihydro-3-hydroxyanthranilate isomerase